MIRDHKNTRTATRPKPEDYKLPRNQVELDKLLSQMKDCGIDASKALEMIKERKMQFDKAISEYESNDN